VEPLPGCERLTRHLTAHGIPFAIATSSSRHTFSQKMTKHGAWLATFHAVRPLVKPRPDAPEPACSFAVYRHIHYGVG
jgi:pseudouridine-5'-monophosphatase